MLKIEKAHTSRMRNETHFQFHTEFRDLVIRHGAAALKIKPQFDAYLLLYEREDLALKKIIKSALTAQIHEADKARDDIYKGLVGTNTSALRHFSESVRSAAAQLKIVLDTYGNAARMSIIDETSTIYNLLQDLQGKYAAEVATVGLEQWVEELQARNEALEALVKSRFDEAAARTDIVLKEARSDSDVGQCEICDRIDALVIVEGQAAYEAFIKALNVVVIKFNSIKHHRHHHAQPETPTP